MNLNWERALIGTILAEPDNMVEAENVLPSDFTGSHAYIWAEMLALHTRGSLGPRALIESLRTSKLLDQIAFDDLEFRGERYIAALASYRGEELPEYVTQVIGAATKRELMTITALIRSEAQDEHMHADEVLERAEQRIMTLRRAGTVNGISGAALVGALSERIQQLQNGGFQPAWISKVNRIAEKIGFLEKEDYIIWAARPGEGKSSVLRTELFFGATGVREGDEGYYITEAKEPSLLINMENSTIEIARNGVAMISGVSKENLKTGVLTDREREAVHNAMGLIAESPLHVVSLGSPDGKQVKAVCRKYIHEFGVSQVYVDYVQLMRNGLDKRNDDVSISSAALRSVALEYGVPVHAAAQMSRNIEGRGDSAEPQLSDLRDSGSLEQDATTVVFIQRVWRSPTAADLGRFIENHVPGGGIAENAVPVKFKIAKNRNGRIGETDPTLFIKDTNRFRSVTV